MLEISQVSKSFQGQMVLHPTSLTLPSGETTVLIGPSGCGKSTLLRLLIGLLQPETGSIRLQGEPLTAANLRTMRLRMGYVIQEGGLFPHLTAWENVALVARQQAWDCQRIHHRLSELAELVRLPDEALQRYPAQLSGGQKQRVGLMRALMLDPDVLLLDEPLGALDPLVRVELQHDLKSIFACLRKTVVLVTHDIGEADFFAHRIILLGEGRIVQTGRLSEMIQRPANEFVRRFLSAQRLPMLREGGK
ncbi:MAG: ATP-binding cassette domain-containing protein [Gemmataceae bacterium]